MKRVAACGPIASASGSVGIVVIGRNEGERLRRCLGSIATNNGPLVYVDSGSADGSVEIAQAMHADVISLDTRTPFTAARARNVGFARLRELAPDLPYIQFVDGDCELVDGWIGAGRSWLDQRPDVAVVCGRLRERFPERSLYNRLCDLEWDRPAGEILACGGIAMMRADAFSSIGGFNPLLTSGEEPDLCLRLRIQGGRVWRLADEMAWHDAAMTRFDQWWRRAMRGGYAAAAGTTLHAGRSGAGYRLKLFKIAAWALGLPLSIFFLVWTSPWGLALAAAYPLQVARLAMRARATGANAWISGFFTMLANFPEAAGVLKYFVNSARGRPGSVIEYH